MDRSPGFGSTPSYYAPYSDSVSLRLLPFKRIKLAYQNNSPVHYAKGTPSPISRLTTRHRAPTACKSMNSGSISLPSLGFFSTFPHGTCPLSVQLEYLALSCGQDRFPRDSTCPVVLGMLFQRDFYLSHTGLSPSLADCSKSFC